MGAVARFGVIKRALLLTAFVCAGAATGAPLTTAANDATITVTGTREAKSQWHKAETDHVIIYSDGSEKELIRIARNIEKLQFLLSVVTEQIGREHDVVKLRIFLIGEDQDFNRMNLRNVRSEEGPFVAPFTFSRYYDPREEGPVMALTRFDARLAIDHGTTLASLGENAFGGSSSSPSSPQAGGGSLGDRLGGSISALSFSAGSNLASVPVNTPTVMVTADARLYSAYAEHFLLTAFPIALPRWYVEGFGQVFASFNGDKSDVIEFGRGPDDYGAVIAKFGRTPLTKILDESYLNDSPTHTHWTPQSAWLLTHYLLFSPHRGQLKPYFTALKNGMSAPEAMRTTVDVKALERDIGVYAHSRKFAYLKFHVPAGKLTEPDVKTLTVGNAIFIKGRLELGSRIELPEVPPPGADANFISRVQKARAKLIEQRTQWVTTLRNDAAKYAGNLEAQLLLAEADCRLDAYESCAASADQALRIAPQSRDALVWLGTARAHLALTKPTVERVAALQSARASLIAANRLDPDAPLPLLAYYRSFTSERATPPDIAIDGLMKVTQSVPQAPMPRIELGEAYLNNGLTAEARAVLLPVAQGAFNMPESAPAARLLGAAN